MASLNLDEIISQSNSVEELMQALGVASQEMQSFQSDMMQVGNAALPMLAGGPTVADKIRGFFGSKKTRDTDSDGGNKEETAYREYKQRMIEDGKKPLPPSEWKRLNDNERSTIGIRG